MPMTVLDRTPEFRPTRTPFAHWLLSPALDDSYYRELVAAFPPLAIVAGPARKIESNTAYLMSAAEVLDHPGIASVWKEFFEAHVATDFCRRLVQLTEHAMRDIHPDLERQVGRSFGEMTTGVRRLQESPCDLTFDCQFGINSPVLQRSTPRTPHVDRPNKLFNALLYFRADDDDSVGGELELYEFVRTPGYFNDQDVVPTRIRKTGSVLYEANKLVIFCNSPRSVHGVNAREPTRHTRRYINFLCEFRRNLFETPQVPRWRRWAESARARVLA